MENGNKLDYFELTIKNYLDKFALTDSVFSEKYNNPEKDIHKCCEYIYSEVNRLKRRGFCDDEIYGMAVHYYDEDDLKYEKVSCSNVVVNHVVELSEEEKERARKEAFEDYKRKYSQEHFSTEKKVTKQKPQAVQPSLFDF